MEYTQQPKVFRPSWYTIPAIFSTIQSYTSAVEWFYYLTFISHILCKSDSAHIAKAHLISFLRARPHIQMWHEALLSEMYDEDEPNLPSVLEEISRVLHAEILVDDERKAAELAKDAQTRKVLEEQGVAVQQREQARRAFEASCLRFGSIGKDVPAAGQIGVLDLAALLAVLSLQSPFDLPVTPEPGFAATVAPVQQVSWLKGLARSLAQLAVEVTPSYTHLAA
ncbi:hypothetical protein J4E86_007000 [Alternaria arbusti]|uniref:uncharacterized protein n=1 Tax=Alternaria arbusti TaxID=232088 RepID=UPI00221F93D7|nr:uncharacterized protein J4E86_007000 [Alternaria arbusti]KAI4951584.1 hypothetical protein J4E86_007000 [Alternaria arbusti]